MQPSNRFSRDQELASEERLWQADPSDQTTLRRAILKRQRHGLPIPEQLFHALLSPPRTFSSDLPLQVGAILADGSLARIGESSETTVLSIPENRVWWVQPDNDDCDLDALSQLIQRENIPGLALSGIKEVPEDFLAQLRDLVFLDLGELAHLFQEAAMLQPTMPEEASEIDASLEGRASIEEELLQAPDPLRLDELANFKQLSYLNLERCDLHQGSNLEPLSHLTALHHLNLSHNPRLETSQLGGLGKLVELYSLDLGWNRLELGENLSWLTKLQQLSVLSLIEVRDRHGELRQLTKLPRLRSFDASNSVLLGQGLAGLSSHPTLARLNLAYSFWDTDLALFATLPGLLDLDLKCCDQVDDAGLELLASAPKLKRLGLVQCQRITDLGLSHLSSLSSLEELDLENCSRITEEGIKSLVKLPRLRRLSLACCSRLSNSALSVLEDLSCLEELDITSCQLSKKSVEQLRESFEGRLRILEWK
ncbi:MAG: hypothetical protein P1V97_07205 [Planctomycetota bacterium]|nr:hypothetical protein [Planctomycetota bacterium]